MSIRIFSDGFVRKIDDGQHVDAIRSRWAFPISSRARHSVASETTGPNGSVIPQWGQV